MSDKKYYWLKLQRDFFKRHDIRIIEDMDNGKDYILFYMKLLVESIDHEGMLRFSETIPYNEKMLSTITNTNIDIVRSALEAFRQLQMIEILDDSTIFMTEVSKMIGSETDWARKKREYRLSIEDNSRTSEDNVRQEIEIELEKELEIDKEKENKAKPKPTKHKYGEYSNVLLTDEELEKLREAYPDYLDRIERLSSYVASTGKSYKSHYATILNWARRDAEKPVQKSAPKRKYDERSYDWDAIEEALTR